MTIEVVEVYRTMGMSFDTEAKALGFRRDRIGQYMDSIMNEINLGPGQKIKLVEWAVDNRETLARLLDY